MWISMGVFGSLNRVSIFVGNQHIRKTSTGAWTKTTASLINQIIVVRQQHNTLCLWCRGVGVVHVSQADPCPTSHTAEYAPGTYWGIVSLTFLELSKIISWKYTMPEITFMVRISSFSLKFSQKVRFLQYTKISREYLGELSKHLWNSPLQVLCWKKGGK